MWVLDNIRIYVEEINDEVSQNIVKLQPVQGGTVYQVFGYTLPTVNITGKVVGYSGISALHMLASSGTYFTLSGYGVNYGEYYVSKIGTKRIHSISQTIDKTLPCDSPIFNVDLELYKTT